MNKWLVKAANSRLGDRLGVGLVRFVLGLLLLVILSMPIVAWDLIQSGHGKVVAVVIQLIALVVIFLPGRDRWSQRLPNAHHEYSSYVAATLVGCFFAGVLYDMLKAALGSERSTMFACILVLLAFQRIIIIAMRHGRLAKR
jgi:O-antigen/teichoic acid export membrane protein